MKITLRSALLLESIESAALAGDSYAQSIIAIIKKPEADWTKEDREEIEWIENITLEAETNAQDGGSNG